MAEGYFIALYIRIYSRYLSLKVIRPNVVVPASQPLRKGSFFV